MAITIKDIAREAGVSHATVSRALHDHPAISSETIEKIKRLAARMGYVPNASARGLKTRRSRALGVIVSNIDDPFWSEVLQGVDEVLHPTGYSLFIAATHRDEQREKEVVQTMVQRGVEGVILCAPQFSQEQNRILQSYGLATTIVNNEGASDASYLVFNDDVHGIRLLTRHLIALGHARIAYLGNQRGGRTTIERETGFREEMRAAGLAVDERCVYLAPEGTPPGGLKGAQHLLTLDDPPTAILCYNDNMAIGVYAALHQSGRSVPHDISVAGYDDIAIAPYLIPPLTTLRQSKRELGAEAANLMLRILAARGESGGLPAPQKLRLQGELVVRGSTAPPRC
ncbi:MAG: LacI family DNA-binding transcriptional regulator [Anaerolineales bacterium]|nr:LacI family DNA-binding transcriptional regulator [Anaerolineales bacterium]